MSTDSTSGWAAGWTIFAAVWMWILGAWQFFAGLAGILEDQVIVPVSGYLINLDVTAWGWIHLLLGVLVFLAGFALFQGAVWARTVGIVLAFISILNNFAWLPNQPVWSILMIAAAGFIIWALALHGDEITSA